MTMVGHKLQSSATRSRVRWAIPYIFMNDVKSAASATNNCGDEYDTMLVRLLANMPSYVQNCSGCLSLHRLQSPNTSKFLKSFGGGGADAPLPYKLVVGFNT